jgi:type IV pilus assembly protein PilM
MQTGWQSDLVDSVSRLVSTMRRTDQGRLDEQDLKQIGGILKQVVKKSGAIGRSAVASIPVSGVFSAVITMPKTAESEFKIVAEQESSKLLPLPPDQMVLDFQKIEEKEQSAHSQRILVTAVSKVLVEEYTKIFNYAGLSLSNLETESFALIRALLGNDKSSAFILDIGTARTNLFVVHGGVPLLHRSINLGGQNFSTVLGELWDLKERELIEQAKLDLSRAMPGAALPAPLVKIVDPIVQELKYQLEILGESKDGNGVVKPEKIVLTGGSSLVIGLSRYLEETFNITTYVGDPWARVVYPQALKSALDSVGARFAVAVGLAARNI